MTSQFNPSSKCLLTLYHTDKRVSNSTWCDVMNISFSKQTVNKINDVICGYFDVKEESDRKLFKCIFLDGTDFNWFHFNQSSNPDIILGVKINGDKRVVFNDAPNKAYVPIEDLTKKLSVSVRSVLGDNDYELTYEQIRKERSTDFGVVALFNCNSFNSFVEASTNLGFARRIEKLNIVKS